MLRHFRLSSQQTAAVVVVVAATTFALPGWALIVGHSNLWKFTEAPYLLLLAFYVQAFWLCVSTSPANVRYVSARYMWVLAVVGAIGFVVSFAQTDFTVVPEWLLTVNNAYAAFMPLLAVVAIYEPCAAKYRSLNQG